MSLIEVKVPDIGDFDDVPVIDLFVKVGDTIKVDDAIVTLESDKATMDVPSSTAGVVKEVLVKLGDKVSKGSVVAIVEASGAESPSARAEPVEASASIFAPARRNRSAVISNIVASGLPKVSVTKLCASFCFLGSIGCGICTNINFRCPPSSAFNCITASPVVPLPAKKSRTISLGSVLISVKRCNKDGAFG